MSYKLIVPQTGESITEVQVGEWLKSEGDVVERDEAVVVLETDKATVELPAPEAGVLKRILKPAGEFARVEEALAVIEEGEGAAKRPAAKSKKPAATKPAEEPAVKTKAKTPEKGPAKRVMPAAKRAMAQAGLGPEDVEGTGPGGRVLKEDVAGACPAAAPTPAVFSPPVDVPPDPLGREEEVVPMSMIRRRIADRLVSAQHNAALLTTFNEIDMSTVMVLRRKRQDAFVARHGIKLGFMSFFVKAAVDALKQFPAVNGSIRDRDFVFHNYYDIGVAIGGGKGLVVPVLRDADRMSFGGIEQAIADFSERARANRLDLDDLKGGTFTISNGGVYGSLLSTPILNPPQSGVLGLHGIKERPVAVDGQVVIRPMMYVALTYDHRMVDGREAVTFLKRIRDVIEDPSVMLLEV
ncbi:MAG: 2-oxoglutarate dehydrogenase complex dihydrolipoyllysine-residue succinyltransferase [Deltaproteobacteria bacterium]|nr:2-oxoglutarate dehydrogenase complex dihydrolipoyllysine-residue succinyltransferase [Deltaproteobacteria bacterium]